VSSVWFVLAAKLVCHRLIKSLIPTSVVPEAAVLKLVSSISRSVPPIDTQVIVIMIIIIVSAIVVVAIKNSGCSQLQPK